MQKTQKNLLEPFFYDYLYKPGEIIEIRMLPGNKNNGHKPKSFFYEADGKLLDNIQQVIKTQNKDYNLYFGVMPRTKKGETKQVSRINACFLDIDKKNFSSPEEFERHLETLEKKIFPSLKIKQTAKVFTGNGVHYYFVLTQTETIQPEIWKEIQCALIEFCKGDKQIKDLPRILRIPSSYNIKDPKNFKLCELVQIQKSIHSISSFDSLISRYRKFKQREEKEREAARATQSYSGEKETLVNAVLETLREKGSGLFSDRADYLRFCYACKAVNLTYDQIDPILCQSENYNYDKNKKDYEKLQPSKVDFGTAYYFAERADSGRLKELLSKKPSNVKTPSSQKVKMDEVPFPDEAPPEGKVVSITTVIEEEKQEKRKLKIFSAVELGEKKIEPIIYVVPGILPEGLAILAGRPKIGKSWMALNLGISVSTGTSTLNSIPTNPRQVLYISLEDGERRLQNRMQGITREKGFPQNLFFSIQMSQLNSGGFEELEEAIDSRPDLKLLIIDPYQKIKNISKGKGNAYEEDYLIAGRIQSLALKKKICILLIHHLRKMATSDFLESVSGSIGLTGAADTTIVLDRLRNETDAVMKITGRDVEERELAVRFNKDTTEWELIGEASYHQQSKERQEVIDLLREEGKPMRDKDISEILGKSYDVIRKTTYRMCKANLLYTIKRGLYTLPDKFLCPSSPSEYCNTTSPSSPVNEWDTGTLGNLECPIKKSSNIKGLKSNGTAGTDNSTEKLFTPSDLLFEYKDKYNSLISRRATILQGFKDTPDETPRLTKELEVIHMNLERTLKDIRLVYKPTDNEIKNGFQLREGGII